MAADEALLLHAASTARPCLRLYRWDQPTLSFGYFLRFEDAARAAASSDTGLPSRCAAAPALIRRWTGGGMVPHHDTLSLTWTLAVPRSHSFCALRPAESYASLHQALADCLTGSCQLADITLVPPEAPAPPGGLCAQASAPGDLIRNGRKIAGAGQRRTRHGLLHQAVILLDPAILGSRFLTLFAHILSSSPEFTAGAVPPAALLRRYQSPDWNHRR